MPYSVFAVDTLLYAVNLTSDPVTFTFDLKHLQCIACDVMKLCTKFERNRAIRGGVFFFNISLNDLEHVSSVALRSWIIFTKFDLRQLVRDSIMAFFDADTLCHAVTLNFDPLTLKVHDTSSVT